MSTEEQKLECVVCLWLNDKKTEELQYLLQLSGYASWFDFELPIVRILLTFSVRICTSEFCTFLFSIFYQDLRKFSTNDSCFLIKSGPWITEKTVTLRSFMLYFFIVRSLRNLWKCKKTSNAVRFCNQLA